MVRKQTRRLESENCSHFTSINSIGSMGRLYTYLLMYRKKSTIHGSVNIYTIVPWRSVKGIRLEKAASAKFLFNMGFPFVCPKNPGITLPETNKSPWKIHNFDGIYQERWDFHGLC